MPHPTRLVLTALFCVIAVACGGDGETVRTPGATTLGIGDCYNNNHGGDDVGGDDLPIPAVPCEDQHDNEVFHTFDLPAGNFPGDAVVTRTAFQTCLEQFEGYVGVAFVDSDLDLQFISPTADRWQTGDREVVCYLFDFDFDKLQGTMKGSGF